MRIFGFDITRTKDITPTQPGSWGSWGSGWGSGWWPWIREPYTGAWQHNMEIRSETVLTYNAVYACVTLISSDVSKLRLRLVQEEPELVWSEIESSAFSPVLRKPNRYQTRIQFFNQWIMSKLIHGNTYVLKERDQRGVVVRLYILDPAKTKPFVAPDGSIYYQLSRDDLTGLDEDGVKVPASEIIHDRMSPIYHPLCGVSPITACALAAYQGLAIQNNSQKFFQNGSSPSGILTAPGAITDDTARRLKDHWEQNYTGNNVGKVAVLGDGLKFEAMTIKAVDAQLIEQLKWTAETVCSCFHVPPYMIGVGPMPSYNNIEALNQQYYTQCLQILIEEIELLLDEGLGLVNVEGKKLGTAFDLDDLLRMDTATKVKAVGDSINAGFLTPNEARVKFDYRPVDGGDTPYLQQQNYSLSALSKRDQGDDPFATKPSTPPAEEDEDAEQVDPRSFADKILSRAKHHALSDAA